MWKEWKVAEFYTLQPEGFLPILPWFVDIVLPDWKTFVWNLICLEFIVQNATQHTSSDNVSRDLN